MARAHRKIGSYEAFREDLSLSKDETCRELYRQNTAMIRIKKENVAVKNLVRIIDSTLKLANSKGFSAMTLRDLCADSGLSMGGLYAYIKNKDDLIHLIQGHGFIMTRRTLLTYIELETEAPKRLFAAIRAHLYLSELMRAWFYFSFMEAKSLPPREKKDAVAIEREIDDIFHDILDRGVSEQVFRAVDTRTLSAMIKALLQDWYLKRRKYRDNDISVEHYAATVGDLLDRYLTH
ncbi:TetR/AcrR family transcriptional regulator [Marinobacter caseinilyticus]|uniref:TetR/AcrR family transcriptional regulator n=1 Tax=Marinobacter caseinilyticus TaxID=2692195 RepID=UPI00140BC9AB|nr:TetR/AcrR family transcriptional regulator [Marinobacter caseinilyticus]